MKQNHVPVHEWQSRIQPGRYLAEFPQELPALRDFWSVDALDNGARMVLLPNRVAVRLSGDPADLGLEEPEEFQTSMLLKHSLASLPVMAESGDIDGVERILAGYASFILSARWAELSGRMTSLDHCVAVRIRVMCQLRAIYALLGRPLPDAACAILSNDLAWASNADNYAPNNHGIMLGISTMHAAEIFPSTTPTSASVVGAAQLDRIIDAAFDDKWVCVENTPEYQGFYLTLCTNLLKFLEATAADDGVRLDRLRQIVTGATSSLSRFLLPNGNYPALGDSGTPSAPAIPPEDGVIYSPATGVYVEKQGGIYFSFKCGYRSYVHKHMDDTSITLTLDSEDLIVDAGLHNYDWHDPITRAVKSQRGHSGFFFPEFDHLYPSTMYRPEKYRIKSRLKLLRSSRGVTSLSGRSIVDDTHRVARLVSHSPGLIDITDRYWVLPGASDASVPVQRFLVPLSFKDVSPRRGVLRFEGAASWIELSFEPMREVTVSIGTGGELPRGWMSRGWSSAIACRAIDIAAPSGGLAAHISLRYGRASNARHLPATESALPACPQGDNSLPSDLDDSSTDHNGAAE